MKDWRLVADIGGGNARFARAGSDGTIHARQCYPVCRHASFEAALEAYLATGGGLAGCASVRVAAAGPLVEGAIELTNGTWCIDTRALSARFAKLPVGLMNDLMAVALALPHLDADATIALGDGRPAGVQAASKLVINIGTGFGAAALLDLDQHPRALPSEPGHMSLPSLDAADLGALARAEPPFRSVEDVLSGPGLARLYHALRGPDMATPAAFTPSEVIDRAGHDPLAREAMRLFTLLLGRIVGDLVLAHAAWGRAYLCGSVARA